MSERNYLMQLWILGVKRREWGDSVSSFPFLAIALCLKRTQERESQKGSVMVLGSREGGGEWESKALVEGLALKWKGVFLF